MIIKDMSHLVHDSSMLGGSLETQPHGGVPSTNVEVVSSYDDIYLPISQSYNAGDVVQFQIAQTQDYTDLAKSYVLVTGAWSVNSGNFGTLTTSVAAGFPDTCLFDRQELYYNGQKVTPSRGGDAYIQFVNKCLIKPEAGYESDNRGTAFNASTLGGGMLDEGENLFFLDSADAANKGIGGAAGVALTADQNLGGIARKGRIFKDILNSGVTGANSASNACQYIYQPQIGAWNDIKKYLPDRVDMRLELTVAPNTFYNIVSGGGQLLTFTISKMELVLHHVRLRKEVIEQNNLAMLERPWEAPFIMNVYQRKNILGGGPNISVDLSSVYQGPIPKLFAVFAQDGSLASSAAGNPFYFNEGVTHDNGSTTYITGGFDNLSILVNGREYPRRPYELQSSNRTTRMRQYRDFVQACSTGWSEKKKPMVSYLQFCTNHPVHMFWIDPLQELHDQYSKTEDCNIEVHGNILSNANTSASITVHTIAFVPAVLEIDGSRNVHLRSKSKRMLEFN